MKTTRFVWTCSSTCFVFLTCLLTWLLHQFLWPIFFLLDYLIYCSVSFPLPTLTQLVHNLMPLFNSLLSALTPFPFAKVFLLRSPFSKGEVFWSFFQRFFLQLSFSQWFIFHHVPKAEKRKADLSNQFVTVQWFDNFWQRDYTNIWMQLWVQS